MDIFDVANLANDQVDHLLHGDVDAFVDVFDLPLPIFTPLGFSVVTQRAQLCATIKHLMAILDALSVTHVKPAKISMEDNTRRRCLASIEWTYQSEDGVRIGTSTARYVLRQDVPFRPLRVEMVEHETIGFPTAAKVLHNLADH